MKLVNKLLIIILAGFLITGCVGTVVPHQVTSQSASYDNGERNSGFYGFVTNSGVAYGSITPHARDRYNALIDAYGKKILPPIKTDYGITYNSPTNYLISLEGLADFSKMNRWHKNDQATIK